MTPQHLDPAQRALLDTMGIWWPAPQDVAPQAPAQHGAARPAAAVPGTNAARSMAAPAPAPAPGGHTAAPRWEHPQAPASAPFAGLRGNAPAGAGVPAAAATAGSVANDAPLAAAAPQNRRGDWAAWVQAVGQCQACDLHATRGTGVLRPLEAPVQADWMVVLDPPEAAEELEQQPVVGDSARLLDAMLRTVGVRRGAEGPQGAYLSTVLKCRLPPGHVPQAQELAQCQQHLLAEIARVRPRVLLLMGRFALRLLPQAGQVPLEQLRTQVYQFGGVPTVVSYPPRALLRNPAHKARAWADLCLAAELAAGRGAPGAYSQP